MAYLGFQQEFSVPTKVVWLRSVGYLVRSSEIVEWVPPSRALIKINFDRAFDRHRSRSSSRVVARNVVGEVLVARTVLHEDVDSIFVMEVLACS